MSRSHTRDDDEEGYSQEPDSKVNAELKQTAIALLDSFAARADTICVCELEGECTLGECCNQKVFLMDVVADHCTESSFSGVISKWQAISDHKYGDEKTDPDEKFPNWQDHILKGKASNCFIRWPERLLLMSPETHTVTVPIRLPDKHNKFEATAGLDREHQQELIPTKHFIKSPLDGGRVIQDGYTTVLSARVASAITEHGHEPFNVNLITSGNGKVSVIDTGAGVVDPRTGKSSAVVPHITPTVQSSCKSEQVLASSPPSLTDPYLAYMGVPKESLVAFIRKYRVRPTKRCKLVAFRAPPTSSATDPSLPSSAKEAYANIESKNYENVFRALVLRFWSFFDKETRDAFAAAPASDLDWSVLVRAGSATQPAALTGDVLGAWQVHTIKNGTDTKQVNMFVVTIASLQAMWSALFGRIQWNRIFMPYSSVGVLVKPVDNSNSAERAQIVGEYDTGAKHLVYLYMLVEVTTALWKTEGGGTTSVLKMIQAQPSAGETEEAEYVPSSSRKSRQSRGAIGGKPCRRYEMTGSSAD
jgi:hypothetical protein